MTIKDLEILFRKETGMYPPFSRFINNGDIKRKKIASEKSYIEWLKEKFFSNGSIKSK